MNRNKLKRPIVAPAPTRAQTKAVARGVTCFLSVRVAAECAGIDGKSARRWLERGALGDPTCRAFVRAVSLAARAAAKRTLSALVRQFRTGNRRAWQALKWHAANHPFAAELLAELDCPPLYQLPPQREESGAALAQATREYVVLRQMMERRDELLAQRARRKPAKTRQTTPRK